jgi:cell division transport system ATP-binding protein
MIIFDSISKIYPNHIVFEDFHLKIKSGEFVCITGTSGCGKTTLIKMLIGDEKPSLGKILVDDVNITDMSEKTLQLSRRLIGVVFQDYKLLLKKTVYENVAFAMEVCGESDHHIHARVPEVLELVGVLKKQQNFPLELSGGEQQRVAIARALVHKPRLLIADEPTGNLDMENSFGIMNLLLKINEMGTTVILTTHSYDMVEYVHKRVVAIQKGKIVYDGDKQGYKREEK